MIQSALALFIESGYYERHVRRAVRDCEKNYLRVVSLFKQYKPEGIELIAAESGLHLLLAFQTELSETQLLELFKAKGILLSPVHQYWYLENTRRPVMLQLGFGALDAETLERAIILLFDTFAETSSMTTFPK